MGWEVVAVEIKQKDYLSKGGTIAQQSKLEVR